MRLVDLLCVLLVWALPLGSVGYFVSRSIARRRFERLPARRTLSFGGVAWAIPARWGKVTVATLGAAFFVFGLAFVVSLLALFSAAPLVLGDAWTSDAVGDALFFLVWAMPAVFVGWLLTLRSARQTHARRLQFTHTHLSMDVVPTSFAMTEDDVAQPLSAKPEVRVLWEDVGDVVYVADAVIVRVGRRDHRFGPVTADVARNIVDDARARIRLVSPDDRGQERGRLEGLQRRAVQSEKA